jgi:hypothetical protein
MEKKSQIFISSTFKDLKIARLKVRDAILSMYHFPVGMEMFGALDEDQWEVIKRDIDASDYYVLIIGKMFGSEVPKEGISYTQKEYRYAVKQGIPVLAFLMKDEADVAKTYQETDKKRIEKLKAFRKEVETGRTVSYWSNPDELAGQVIASLARQIVRKQRPGWVRASEFDIEKSHAELLELTEKVRELESENADLRKITGEKREPKLKIDLFQPVKFEITDPEPVPDYLRKAAEEGKTYKVTVGHRMVEHEAAELEADYELRSYIMAGFAWLDFVIKNEGTCKATDVTVEIDVPVGLMAYETTDLGMYTELTIPGSLIGNKKKNILLEGARSREGREEFPEGLFAFQSANGWEADGNHIEIDVDEIRHYSGKRCAEFFATASKPGTYKLKCRLMCAEYADPDYQELTIEVVKAEADK